MKSNILPLLFILAPLASAKKVDLVKLGHTTFHSIGCAECHSEIKNDSAVKTGPGLWGVFQKKPRKREIIAAGENHRLSIPANLDYLKKSLRKPHTELSIAEIGFTKGQAYLPIMPPYDKNLISDFKVKAIYQYLLTLNDPKNQGPAKVMAEFKKQAPKLSPEKNPAELLVTKTTRTQRVRLDAVSARAIAVGHPSGLNYTFDPRTLSIEQIWWGGFLNIAHEIDGRAKKNSRLGHQAQPLPHSAPLLQPIHPESGKLIDLSFQSPLEKDTQTLEDNLYGKEEFFDRIKETDAFFKGYQHGEKPTFHYQCGPNQLSLQFHALPSGEASLTLTGKLQRPQKFALSPLIDIPTIGKTWTVSQLPAVLNFTLPKPQKIWRPNNVSDAPKKQTLRLAKKVAKISLPKGYASESLLPPLDRHGRPQLFEVMGMDTAPDGSLILTTRTAGVWKLKDESWSLIAEGLHEALGVIAEDDGALIIAQKPELTRLRDKDQDGFYEHYETLSDAFLYTHNYHEYLHGPAKDRDGNYYIQTNLSERKKSRQIYKAKGQYMGTSGGFRAWSLQVTPQGKTTPFAHGLRSPAGLATSPQGHLYYTENQGEFVGTSKLFRLEKDRFYGHPAGLVDLPGKTPTSPDIQWEAIKDTKEQALALLPHARVSNSPGSPTWDTTDGKFGPFSQHMFIGDQTLSNIFRVLPTPKIGTAIIPFAHKFPSGVMRLHFTPNGSLYVGQTGRGWRAKGGKSAALIRLHRTSDTVPNQLLSITRHKNAFSFHFTHPLDSLPFSFNISSWHYLDSPQYGSAELDRTKEKVLGSPSMSKDKRSVTLTLVERPLPPHQRVYQFILKGLPVTKKNAMEAFYIRNVD